MPLLRAWALLAGMTAVSGFAADLPAEARSGNTSEVASLLAQGADIEGQDASKQTPLRWAAVKGHLDTVKLLLDKGADVNARSPEGYSPVMYAARQGHETVASLLLSRGAEVLDSDLARLESVESWRPAAAMLRRLSAAKEAPLRPHGNLDDAAYNRMRASAGLPPEKAAAPAEPVSDVDKPSYHNAEREDDYAVVVGAENYQGLPKAEYAERDARAVREHLVALGVPERNVFLLTGPQASRAGIVKNVETRLAKLVNDKSTVFFYYSGHGAPDPRTGQAYILPVDGDPAFLEDTAYPLKRLYEKLGALPAKHVIVALDSCFSGAGGRSVLAKGARPLVTRIDTSPAPSAGAKITALTASGGDEISGTSDAQGHGLFTYYLLKGLSQGKRSSKALYEFAKPHVQDEARRENRDQTPALTGEDAAW